MDEFSFSEFLSPNTSMSNEDNDILSEMDKENVNSNINDIVKPKSTRKSLLMSLDPLNPYSPSECRIKEERRSSFNVVESKLNQSWNFLELEHSNNKIEEDKKNNENSCDPFQNDILCGETTSYTKQNMSCDSKYLDESVEENDIAVENLLSITPEKKFVEKAIHDKLRRQYRKELEEWKKAEKMFQDQIEQLKRDKENEISRIAEENEIKINEIVAEKHLRLSEVEKLSQNMLNEFTEEKEALITELLKENEENLERLRSSQAKMLIDKLEEIRILSKEKETMREEISYLNCASIVDKLMIEQYTDTIEEINNKHTTDEAVICQDNKEMEDMLNKCFAKIDSSKKIISNLQQNEIVLRGQLSKSEESRDQLNSELARKSAELSETTENFSSEIANLRSDADRKLKRKEIRIVLLENSESNLKTELELRVAERDLLRNKLKEALELN